MITKPKVQKRRIQKWLVNLDGGTETTNTLDQIAEPFAREVLSQAALEADEEALLANYRGRAGWCLLTTKRFIWFQDEHLSRLSWNEIIGAQQPPAKAAQIIREELGKHEIAELEIFDASGRKHVVSLEPGPPYYTIWSAILAFCRLTRMPDPIPGLPSLW